MSLYTTRDELLSIGVNRQIPIKFIKNNNETLYDDIKDCEFEHLSKKYNVDIKTVLYIYVQKVVIPELGHDESVLKNVVSFYETKLSPFKYDLPPQIKLFNGNPDNMFDNVIINSIIKKTKLEHFLNNETPNIPNDIKRDNFKIFLDFYLDLESLHIIGSMKQNLIKLNKLLESNIQTGLFNSNLLSQVLTEPELLNLQTKLTPYEKHLFQEQLLLLNDRQEWFESSTLKDKLTSKKCVPYDKFNKSKEEFNIWFTIKDTPVDIGLVYIFDMMKTTNNIPYIKYNDYFKIFDDFIPNKDWVLEDNTVDNDQFIILRNDKHLIKIKLDPENGYYINVQIKNGKTQIDSLIELVRQCLDSDIIITKKDNFNVFGNYYIPLKFVNKYIFKDLVMNNKLFNNFITFNDNVFNPNPKRVNNTISIKFHDTVDNMTLNGKITPKRMTQLDMGFISTKFFKMDLEVIKISIHSKDVKSISKFQDFFGKLLTVYQEEETKLVDQYKTFIKDFEIHSLSHDDVRENMKLRERAPHLFQSRYSSSCSSDRIPELIDDDFDNDHNSSESDSEDEQDIISKVEEIEKDSNYLIFPKDNSLGPRVLVYCGNNENNPHVGLIENKQKSNSDSLPYVPCCFNKPQKGNEIFKSYENNVIKEKSTKNNRFVVTNKFLNSDDQIGTLTDKLDDFFKTFQGLRFLRKGVSNGNSSFLECVFYALNYDGYVDKPLQDRIDFTSSQRKKLKYNHVSKQECYDMTEQQINSELSNLNVYLDPQKYISIIEHTYDILVFLFDRNGFLLPRHINGYYKNLTKETKVVLIIQHDGGLYSKTNKCELILSSSVNVNNDENKYIFDSSDNIINEIAKTEMKLNRIFNSQSLLIRKPILPNTTRQYIDKYGKCRVLESDNIIFITEPMSPLNVPLLNNIEKDQEFTLKQVEDYISTHNNKNKNKRDVITVHSKTRTKITIMYKHNLFSVSMKDTNTSPLLLTEYIFMEKYTRQLFQFLLFKYSVFLFQRKRKHDKLTLTTFMETINIGKSEPILFDYNIEKDRNIVISDKTTRDHIEYNMNVYIRNNNLNLIQTYHTENVLHNFYNTVHDFRESENTTLIKGKHSIYQWMENSSIFQISDKIIIDSDRFITNGDSLLLKHFIPTISNGLYIGKIWKQYGYIPITGTIEQDLQYNMVLFRDNKTRISSRGNIPNEYDIVIHSFSQVFRKPKYYVVLDYKFNKQPLFIRHNDVNYILHQTDITELSGYQLYTTNEHGSINGHYEVIGDTTGIKILSKVILGKIIYYKMNKL